MKNDSPHKQTNQSTVSALGEENKFLFFYFFDDVLKRKLVLFKVELDILGDVREAFPQPPLHAKKKKAKFQEIRE